MKDMQFRMMIPHKIYGLAWKAVAKAYGEKSKNTLTPEGDEAFDTFCGGYWKGYLAGQRANKKKEAK